MVANVLHKSKGEIPDSKLQKLSMKAANYYMLHNSQTACCTNITINIHHSQAIAEVWSLSILNYWLCWSMVQVCIPGSPMGGRQPDTTTPRANMQSISDVWQAFASVACSLTTLGNSTQLNEQNNCSFYLYIGSSPTLYHSNHDIYPSTT